MLIGIDYASVDGNLPPDLTTWQAACAAQGSRAALAIIRAVWGTKPDATLRRDWDRLTGAGLTCGGYLLLRMPHSGFSAAPEDQVHVLADVLGRLTTKHLVPTIDIEDTGLPASEELEWVHRAWKEVRRIWGVSPMFYTSDRVWREDLHNLPAGEMTDSPLWLAKPWPWAIRQAPQLSGTPFASGQLDPKVPSPWGAHNWWMHQYQGDAYHVPGFTSTVDLSRFRLMRVGEIGPRVAWVQHRLALAEGVAQTFEDVMLTQVKAFQTEHALEADGIIGPQTFAALTWSDGRPRPTGA